jgi:glycine/betaine/sarcosine/D-proline reductase family selenoprotein B
MSTAIAASVGSAPAFTPAEDVPISYMQRTRDYYLALGFGNAYRWSHFEEVPFTSLRTPLARARVALITTAAPYQPGVGDQGPGAAYNAAAKFYQVYSAPTDVMPDLRISHVGYDRIHTSAADPNSYFPLARLQEAVAAGRIGAVTERFHGAPTNRSQRITTENDLPEILRRCREDGADAALIAPICPVCHQTAGLVARHLEASGIPTVIMGCARDIVEHCGVPRLLFSDFPLGNPAGRPFDVESQRRTLELALRLLESAPAARTTLQSPIRWATDASWKRDYLDLTKLTPDVIAEKRKEFDEVKSVARAKRVADGVA